MSSLRAKIDRRRGIAANPPRRTSDEDGENEPSATDAHLEDDPKDLSVNDDAGNQAAPSSDDASSEPSAREKKIPAKRKRTPAKQPYPSNDNDGSEPKDKLSSTEEEFDEDQNKDDEDYNESSSDNKEDEDEVFDSDDDDFKPSKKKKRRAPARKRESSGRATAKKKKKAAPPISAKKRKTRYNGSSNEEEEEDSQSYLTTSRRGREARTNRRTSPRSRKGIRSNYRDVASSGEDSNNDDDGSDESVTQRPSRASAAKATAKIAQLRYREENDDSEDDEPHVQTPRSRKKDSEDDEFEMDNDQDVEDEELDDDSKSDESVVKSAPKRAVGHVDIGDFGEDDVSDNERNEGKLRNAQQRRTVRRTATTRQKSEEYYSDSDNNEDEDEISPTKPSRGAKANNKSRQKKNKQKWACCPSEFDAITSDPLPERHVCFVSPDGQSRQCFALETLHKIAKMSPHPHYRTNLSGEQQLTFLQPPHFRSPMCDDLIDMIASRFGRQALDLDGDFYKRATGPARVPSSGDENEGERYEVNFGGTLADDEEFIDNWRDYQLRTMGSQDIYACPLCYTVAHHRLKTNDREEMIIPPSEFEYDPMTVLGAPDNNEFEVASAFCFKKISDVKRHLKDDHDVDPTLVGDSGLWYKFKVRTQDGLLQRFLKTSGTYGKTKQGDMRRYWYDGNSECYIYLLYQMERLRIYKNILAKQGVEESDDDDEQPDPLRKAKEFFRSFADQAKNLWESLISPYSKQAEDMKDFIAENDEEEDKEDEEAEVPHNVFDQEQAAAEQEEDERIASYYNDRAKRKANASDEDESSNYEDEDENENEAEDERLKDQYHHQSSDSEADEWVKEIRSKGRKHSLQSAEGRVNGKSLSTPNGIRRKDMSGGKKDDSDSDLSVEGANASGNSQRTPSSARRAVLEDSDSD